MDSQFRKDFGNSAAAKGFASQIESRRERGLAATQQIVVGPGVSPATLSK